jgi:hypothetical protein
MSVLRTLKVSTDSRDWTRSDAARVARALPHLLAVAQAAEAHIARSRCIKSEYEIQKQLQSLAHALDDDETGSNEAKGQRP